MFTLGALKRRGTRVMSFMMHSVYEEIAGIVSGSVIDTLGLMAHYAAAYVSLLARTIRLYDTFRRVEFLRSYLTWIARSSLPVQDVKQRK